MAGSNSARLLSSSKCPFLLFIDKANALKLYNRSIAVSPSNAIDLPIAYANKSAVLLEMKDYEACIGNINLALKHPSCPVWLVSALLERKTKCLILLGQWNDSTEKVRCREFPRFPCELRCNARACVFVIFRNCSRRWNVYHSRIARKICWKYVWISISPICIIYSARTSYTISLRFRKDGGGSEGMVICITARCCTPPIT